MRYVVTGRVHPERADIHFPTVKWQIPDVGKAVAYCDSSQITIYLDLPSIDECVSAYVTGEHFAMIVVGALGFSLGSGYSVELIQVTEENGVPHVFGVRPSSPTAEQTLGFDAGSLIFSRAFQLSNENVFFRLALRDYLRAITDSIDCATYCFRAIEGIKSAFVFKTGENRWDDMHLALGTDRATIDSTVKNFADPIRHGNWVNAKPTDGDGRWRMLLLTRDILLKYLDHALPVA